MIKDEIIKKLRDMAKYPTVTLPRDCQALKAAADLLAQPEQEPVALPCCGYTDASAIKWNPYNQVVQCHNCGQVYTTPPQRKPLTDEEIRKLSGDSFGVNLLHFARAIEAAHGIKEST